MAMGKKGKRSSIFHLVILPRSSSDLKLCILLHFLGSQRLKKCQRREGKKVSSYSKKFYILATGPQLLKFETLHTYQGSQFNFLGSKTQLKDPFEKLKEGTSTNKVLPADENHSLICSSHKETHVRSETWNFLLGDQKKGRGLSKKLSQFLTGHFQLWQVLHKLLDNMLHTIQDKLKV